MIKVRPSKLPLAHECPSSLVPAEHPISGGSDASDMGNAVHYVAGAIVLGKPYDVGTIARSFKVAEDELRILASQTARAWAYLRRWFPSPRVECKLTSELLGGGTCDLVHHDSDSAAANDWKSGRVYRNHRWQLWGYALGVRETLGMPSTGVIDSTLTWVRTGDVEHHAFTDGEIDAMAAEHQALEPKIGKVYNPGEHCDFCERRLECEAYRDALRTTVTALAPIELAMTTGQATGLTAAELVRLYPRAKMLEKVLATYNDMLRTVVSGNRMPIGDGRVLYVAQVERTHLDVAKTMGALHAAGWSDEDLASCLDIHKGRIVDIAKAAARATKRRGAITEAEKAITAELEQSGAVTKYLQERLTAAKGE